MADIHFEIERSERRLPGLGGNKNSSPKGPKYISGRKKVVLEKRHDAPGDDAGHWGQEGTNYDMCCARISESGGLVVQHSIGLGFQNSSS